MEDGGRGEAEAALQVQRSGWFGTIYERTYLLSLVSGVGVAATRDSMLAGTVGCIRVKISAKPASAAALIPYRSYNR